MRYDFLVETYATERLKVLSAWATFADGDLPARPHPADHRGRSVLEQMVHQCLSENLWFRDILSVDVGAAPLPTVETRLEFIRRYAEDSARRLAALRDTHEAWWETEVRFFDVPRTRAWVLVRRVAHTAHHRGQQAELLRILNRGVYSTYGPTADTGGLMAHRAPTIYPYRDEAALLAGEAAGGRKTLLPGPGDRPPTERAGRNSRTTTAGQGADLEHHGIPAEHFPAVDIGESRRRPMRILALSGSLRAGSLNTALLQAAALVAPAGMHVTLYEALGDLPHFNPDLEGEALPPVAADLRARIGRAEGVLISCPEYAHGLPGGLKNALDWLVPSVEFPGKPVALLGVSASARHAQAQLTEILTTMAARLVAEASITIPLLDRSIDAAAIAADPVLADPLRAALRAFEREIDACRPERGPVNGTISQTPTTE